ncbi:hypothetical protein [Helicobacter pylori]|nr:hypothetical protein [Helicobacter pylori]
MIKYPTKNQHHANKIASRLQKSFKRSNECLKRELITLKSRAISLI